MQYILTQAEYDALRAEQMVNLTASKDELQKLCTTAAKHIPVSLPWAPRRAPVPWGCILDPATQPVYCDECPAQAICPHDGKEWSQ
ncbi:hypothetical protein GmRootA79_53770 (plasmid) [Acidovorax sp. A79]|uniref:hypothetical protein n=1 Tax=Acidovorax sp. A79 TaxID=3056107 RepID=UPI0034E86FC0